MTNKQLLERLESKIESLSLSNDQSKVNTLLRLEIYPTERYSFDKENFMLSINEYSGHFDIAEWDYLISIASGDTITLDEIYNVIDIFRKVRDTIEFLK
jgi:hypothetical protein